MKKTPVRILLVALLISVVFAVPVFAINLPTVEVKYTPKKDNSTSPDIPEEMKAVSDAANTQIASAFPDEEISIDFDDPVIDDGEILDDSDDNLTASVIADGNMAILLCIVAVAAGAVTVLLLKKRKVKKDD